jgi:hypothetical protein
MTVTDDGQSHSCRYESSLRPNNGRNCDVVGEQAAMTQISGAQDQYTRITFERRFSPGATPTAGALEPGETFLGGQVMALAIDARGAVKGCKIVATSGAVKPEYGCHEASAERFEASVVDGRPQVESREGTMTILVYGHSEHVV